MILATTIAALMAAQAGTAVDVNDRGPETRDVQYDALVSGETEAAIERLEDARADNPNDPALLINLGAAYAAVGDYAKAEEAYRAASVSEERYELELANGDWIDSRRAARMALLSLENTSN
ncbi:tetratricopeptide repeat protein [Aurantiacibacter poecillastricola]|uniref:tetratricopeptide repeat protein n=1 Tax=Aurantiacibacter poecillastricola TaxID=3064385 RepID=UPI00273DED56|nr:tetratricopeptide repeat protein [Aurantiacibacter sp. 219JJ12-13]MDP5260038.1 tetratricopeptide repeat protein [Aurantiacibacter sp. 219JJ12-13]